MNRYLLGFAASVFCGCINSGDLGGGRDAGGDDATAETSVVGNDGSVIDGGTDVTTAVDAGPRYRLFVAFMGFDSENGNQVHNLCIDPSTHLVYASGGGGPVHNGALPQFLLTDTIEAGRSYDYDYWFDTSDFTQFGQLNSMHYVHPFGPVTGDTYVTATPADTFITQ